jgi:hypothetical protein
MATQLVAIVSQDIQDTNVKAVRVDSTEDRKLKEKFVSLAIAVEILIQVNQDLVTVSLVNVFIAWTTHSELLAIYVLRAIMAMQLLQRIVRIVSAMISELIIVIPQQEIVFVIIMWREKNVIVACLIIMDSSLVMDVCHVIGEELWCK